MRLDPLILIVTNTTERTHWTARWQAQCSDCIRVDTDGNAIPHRNTWVSKLSLAMHRANRPILMVAHDLGCHAVAWWAELERPPFGNPVVGALLVAPPDPDRPDIGRRDALFGCGTRQPLPFPAILVPGQDESRCSDAAARHLAGDWQCRVETDQIAQRREGDWIFGKNLVARLTDERRQRQPTHVDVPRVATAPIPRRVFLREPAALLREAGERPDRGADRMPILRGH